MTNYFWERLRDQIWTHYFSYEEARAILSALDTQTNLTRDATTRQLYQELSTCFRKEDLQND